MPGRSFIARLSMTARTSTMRVSRLMRGEIAVIFPLNVSSGYAGLLTLIS